MRKLLALLVVVGGPVLYLRRSRGRREHVQLHFDDGSTVVLERGAPQAERLLELARTAL